MRSPGPRSVKSVGSVGQVITWFHDAEYRNRNSGTLTEFFEAFLSDLRADYYSVDEDGSLTLN